MARSKRSFDFNFEFSSGRRKWYHMDRCTMALDPSAKRRTAFWGFKHFIDLGASPSGALSRQADRPKFQEENDRRLLPFWYGGKSLCYFDDSDRTPCSCVAFDRLHQPGVPWCERLLPSPIRFQ